MTVFKALAVIFDNVDVTINGKHITDSIPNPTATNSKKNEAKNGLKKFQNYLPTLNPNISISITVDDTPKTLKNLNLIKNGTLDSPFLEPADFEKAMQAASPGFSLSWGQYDTIFIIVPANNPGLLAQGWSVNGWGKYEPDKMKGAAIAFIPTTYNMEEFEGQVFLHEWLHGVCHFYKKMGWTDKISSGDADDSGVFGYTKTTANGDLDYYKDLMTAQLKNKKLSGQPLAATPGITNTLWQGGSMSSDIRNVIKNQSFKTAYVNAGGQSSVGFPKSDVHTWNEGGQTVDIMDFYGPAGASAILRLTGDPNAWFLPTQWWNKFLDKGKIGTLGAPISAVHTWTDGGEIVDFKKSDAKQCALMKPNFKNPGQIYYVPNEFWNKFVALGGVEKIGYPQSDVHTWGTGGQILDVETKGGAHGGIMKANNSSKLYFVKGLIWKAYTATSGNGATSYLGYPTSEEYTWKDGLFGWFGTEYYRQDFTGGWCWASKTNVNKFGNDKNFSTNK
jgi:hypothetical protein